MRLERTIKKISAVFAEAVQAGRFAEAEGWLAVARLVAEREPRLLASPIVPVPERQSGPAA
ncbi:MAG TPA: hypothetical protein VFC04_06580 [Actinomycetota bacterium]|nr:hypothetical protein [Actinomycetota bacterium]